MPPVISKTRIGVNPWSCQAVESVCLWISGTVAKREDWSEGSALQWRLMTSISKDLEGLSLSLCTGRQNSSPLGKHRPDQMFMLPTEKSQHFPIYSLSVHSQPQCLPQCLFHHCLQEGHLGHLGCRRDSLFLHHSCNFLVKGCLHLGVTGQLIQAPRQGARDLQSHRWGWISH